MILFVFIFGIIQIKILFKKILFKETKKKIFACKKKRKRKGEKESLAMSAPENYQGTWIAYCEDLKKRIEQLERLINSSSPIGLKGKNYESSHDELSKKNDELLKQNDTLNAKVLSLDETLQVRIKNYDALKRDYETVKQKLDDIVQKYDTLKQNCDTDKSANNTLQQSYDQLKEKYESEVCSLNVKLQMFERKYAKLELELNNARQDDDQSKRNHDTQIAFIKKQSADEIEKLKDAHKKEIESLTRINEENDTVRKFYEEQMEKIKQSSRQQIEKLKAEYNEKVKEINCEGKNQPEELQKILEQKNADIISKLKSEHAIEIEQLCAQCNDEIQQAAVEHNREVNEIKEQYKNEIEKIKKVADDKVSCILADCEERSKLLASQNDEKIKELEAYYNSQLQMIKEKSNTIIKELQDSYEEKALKQREECSAKISTITKEYSQKYKELSDKEKEISEEYLKKCQEFDEKVNECSAKTSQLEVQIETIKRENSSLKEENDKLKKENEAYFIKSTEIKTKSEKDSNDINRIEKQASSNKQLIENQPNENPNSQDLMSSIICGGNISLTEDKSDDCSSEDEYNMLIESVTGRHFERESKIDEDNEGDRDEMPLRTDSCDAAKISQCHMNAKGIMKEDEETSQGNIGLKNKEEEEENPVHVDAENNMEENEETSQEIGDPKSKYCKTLTSEDHLDVRDDKDGERPSPSALLDGRELFDITNIISTESGFSFDFKVKNNIEDNSVGHLEILSEGEAVYKSEEFNLKNGRIRFDHKIRFNGEYTLQIKKGEELIKSSPFTVAHGDCDLNASLEGNDLCVSWNVAKDLNYREDICSTKIAYIEIQGGDCSKKIYTNTSNQTRVTDVSAHDIFCKVFVYRKNDDRNGDNSDGDYEVAKVIKIVKESINK